MRTAVVIQARMGSTRLPGKVLAPVGARPMIEQVIERAARIKGADEVVVAVSDLAEDADLAKAAAATGARVVRGPAYDVLARYIVVIEAVNPDAVVRVTSDCPLLSPSVSSAVLAAFAEDDADYASNTLERTWPRGLDTEVVATEALVTAAREATSPVDREHVTPFIWRQPTRFRLRSVTTSPDRSDLRLTVDTPEDLELVRRVYAELGPDCDIDDVLRLLTAQPSLAAVNAAIQQKPIE